MAAPAPPIVPTAPTARHRAAPIRDAWARQAAAAGLWAALLLVTYWWVADGGITALAGWATGLTALGQLTGLLASVLLLVQVLLMARVPALERVFGQDRLAILHRTVGFTSFTAMLAHIGLITWGYAAGRITAVPATAWELTVDYPGMLLAVAGTVCLVLVVVTSMRAARARLRYESWHLLHLYAYLGVGFALPHQLWTGQEFLQSPARTVFWWGLWIAAAGAVLMWRIGQPVWRSLRHRLVVSEVVPEVDGCVSVHVTGRRLDALPARAGQFLIWRFLAPGWTRGHPYSLSAAPDGRSLRITVKDLGDGSGALRAVRPGTRVLVEGPYGRLTERARTSSGVAMIGAGVGITPLRALADELAGRDENRADGADVVLLHRYRGEPLFADELATLARDGVVRCLPLPGPRRAPGSWLGPTADADDLTALRAWVPDIADRDVYVCGPPDWTRLVQHTLTAAGVPDEAVHIENFGW